GRLRGGVRSARRGAGFGPGTGSVPASGLGVNERAPGPVNGRPAMNEPGIDTEGWAPAVVIFAQHRTLVLPPPAGHDGAACSEGTVNDQPVGPDDRAVQTTPDSTETAKREYLPDRERKGVALCLSGAGSRTARFHLGVLRRLNETGLLAQVDSIASVSGGSILVGHLVQSVRTWQANTVNEPLVRAIADFDTSVRVPFEAFVRRNLRTSPLVRRYL